MEKKFDRQFLQIDFYSKHDYMMPFVGDYYEQKSHKKLLLLGESHYLPKKTSVCFDEKEWYDKKIDLKGEDYNYCNTRNTWVGGASPFHHNVRESLNFIFKCNDPWQHVAFFNYFLRPAPKGKEFKVGKKDAELAVKNLIQVVDILIPDRIVFLSKKAAESAEGNYPSLKLGYKDFWNWAESKKIEYCYTNHPSRSWDSLMPVKYWRDKWHLRPKDLSARNFFNDWLATRL
ncbi:hypothetical protein B7982_14255 [Fibrobacter sp. UWB2]|uniref:hypothetical protein n=1 Tax=Fibrobacter sp. UWB2 TaxID=1964358 RepID=UPI000B523F5D|nr:hypothetical protein [Fibrobacter sp. UWB2]OWV19386.1 hypothetical protein B7982_14255 [Fibrobacter sp. UWB2]